jgi:hypothetical protein
LDVHHIETKSILMNNAIDPAAPTFAIAFASVSSLPYPIAEGVATTNSSKNVGEGATLFEVAARTARRA